MPISLLVLLPLAALTVLGLVVLAVDLTREYLRERRRLATIRQQVQRITHRIT